MSAPAMPVPGTPEAVAHDADSGCAPWPAWLEALRVDDALFARAYEHTPPRCRAALKTGLALAHFHWGESPALAQDRRHDARRGFARLRSRAPAPWALIVFPAAYAAAARLAAACAAARLGGVEQVAALCLDGAPGAPALVSLELSGVEDAFTPDGAQAVRLVRELAAQSVPGTASGRLVVLGAGTDDAGAPLLETARALGLPCHVERREPRLLVEDAAAFDMAALAFGHGTQALLCGPEDAGEPASAPDAVYAAGAADESSNSPAPLRLAPGLEGFWLHAGLGPEFFSVERLCFAPLASSSAACESA